MKISQLLLTAAAMLTSAVLIPTAQAQADISYKYNFVKLEYPGALSSFPLGINALRQIVGVRIDAQGVNHGYLYQNGKFIDIDYPGAAAIPNGGTFTGGINDLGQIAGVFTDAQGYQHGFLRSILPGCEGRTESFCKPSYQKIDVPGAVQTKGIDFELGEGLGTGAAGINDQGEVVGLYATPGKYSAAFKLSHGKFTSIDDPASSHLPGNGSRAFSINLFGDIAGAYIKQANASAPPVNDGFVFNGRDFIPVHVPNSELGGFGTQANGINDLQEVTGVYSDPQGTFHGLYWAGGQSFKLDYPNAPYSENHGINDRGDITGAYIIDLTYAYHGFVAYRKDGL